MGVGVDLIKGQHGELVDVVVVAVRRVHILIVDFAKIVLPYFDPVYVLLRKQELSQELSEATPQGRLCGSSAPSSGDKLADDGTV